MATFTASRTIAADPTSVALLLAGPAASEQFADDSALGETGISAEITAPARTGVGFRASLTVFSAGREIASGSVQVLPAPGEGTALEVALLPARDADVEGLRRWLDSSTGSFALAARSRATAA